MSDAYWVRYPSSGCPGPGQPRVALGTSDCPGLDRPATDIKPSMHNESCSIFYYLIHLIDYKAYKAQNSKKIEKEAVESTSVNGAHDGGCARGYAPRLYRPIRNDHGKLTTHASFQALSMFISVYPWFCLPISSSQYYKINEKPDEKAWGMPLPHRA